jgi:endoglucanase
MARLRITLAVTALVGLTLSSASAASTSTTPAPIVGPLHTAGAGIYDANNNKVTLRGLAREYLNIYPTLSDKAMLSEADIAAMHDVWHVNVVRVFLGEQFWNRDECSYNAQYASSVDQVVQSITSRGMVALLDLHWNTRVPCFAAHQQKMADYPGSVAFWSSVAARYKSNPLVAFQLYNEPHDISWSIWRNGGLVIDPDLVWQAAGMQQMYNAVRTAGATNLVFVTGANWGNTPPPTTSLLDGFNVVYAIQQYTCVSAPPPWCSVPDPYEAAPGPGLRLDQWNSLVSKVPVLVTEFGWPDSNDGRYNASVIAWAEAHGVGWIAYEWGTNEPPQWDLVQSAWQAVFSVFRPPPPPEYGLLKDAGPAFQPTPSGVPVQLGLSRNL